MSLTRELIEALSPLSYIERLGFKPFEWQRYVLTQIAGGTTRICINGARQAGKSTISGGIPSHVARYGVNPLGLIFAPSERQSIDNLAKVKEFLGADPFIRFDSFSTDTVKIVGEGTVMALPSTEKTIRGKSKPGVLVVEEASRIEDPLYYGLRPMLVDNPTCVLIQISTPYGRKGVFYRTFHDPRWLRIEVRAPWDIERDSFGKWQVVPADPEEVYRAKRAEEGIVAFYSPRHYDRDFMQEELDTIGEKWFRQEYLCEFVSTGESAFDFDDIDAAFERKAPAGLFVGDGLETACRPLFM